MKHITIIQPSLRKESFTDILCTTFAHFCEKCDDISVHFIDLRERNLEFCDGRDIHEYNSDLQEDYEILKKSDVIILGFPIYHYAISGVLKNYVDIMGDAFSHKKIDFLVTGLFRECAISYEYFFESMQKKYHTEKVMEETVYVIDNDFVGGKCVNMLELKKLSDLTSKL